MIEHTKEPWPNAVKDNEFGPGSAEYWEISGVGQFYGSEQDARRIVACVNACAGFANPEKDIPAIETGSKMHFDQAMANGQRAAEYEAQRDELLAALKVALAYLPIGSDQYEKTKASIAKVK